MKRILPRYVYSSIVGLVIVTMSVNPASGGWLMHKLRCRIHAKHAAHKCAPVKTCEPVCETPEPACGECPTETVAMECPTETCDACGSSPMMQSMPMHGEVHLGKQTIDSAPMIECWSEWKNMEGSSVVMPMQTDGPSSSDVVPATPTPATPTPATPTPATPTPAAEPTPAAPATPKAETKAAPPEVKPAAPLVMPPAPQVKPPAPVEPPPAADDLFDAPAAEPAVAPVVEPAVPAAAPMDDDLFGVPADEPAAPAEAPAEGGEMDNLFDDKPNAPADAAPPAADEGMDDLFGAPAADDPADTAPAADDIFGEPAAAPAAEPAKEAADDPFGSQQAEPVDPLANSRVRVWIDNTGEFSTEGRLIEIGSDYIRLEKTNGNTCTVPNSRLCPADAAYVAAINNDRNDIKLAMASTSR